MNQFTEHLILSSGEILCPDNLDSWRNSPEQKPEECRAELAEFLKEWWSDSDSMLLQSSGSTGEPKQFYALKQHMRASAQLSCECLGLKAGQSVLLRLPIRYIAAKMMIVRCLVAQLKLCLREAKSNIWEGIDANQTVDFAPIVSIQAAQVSEEDLARIGTILLGGGLVPENIERKLSRHPGLVYASYGMTETLSHIALRRINGDGASPRYTALRGVACSMDSNDCLVLTVPHLGIEQMATHDIVTIHEDGRFSILGRQDNIINSGGIKLQAEQIEEILKLATGLNVVALAQPHEQLGQSVALLWEGSIEHEAKLQEAIATKLSTYQTPKYIRWVDELPRTSSGKIARARALPLLQKS